MENMKSFLNREEVQVNGTLAVCYILLAAFFIYAGLHIAGIV
jgi:hypothetical protein